MRICNLEIEAVGVGPHASCAARRRELRAESSAAWWRLLPTSRGGSCAEAGPEAGSSTTRRNAASTRRALTRRALTRRASNRRASTRRASQRGGNRKLRRRCMLVLNCEVRARRMGLQPRLVRAASSCACSEAASSPWSGSRGRDQQRTAKIVPAGVAGPAASDRGGEAEMRAPTRMRPPPTTTPAKIKPRRSRHAHAADEPATAEAVPFKQPLLGSRNHPEVPPIKEGIQSCKQSRREESNERSKKKKPQGGVITMP